MLTFQVLVVSEINSVINIVESDFNEVSEESLIDCMFKSLIDNIGEDVEDKELVEMFKESSIRIYDSREDSETEGKFNDIVLSPERYGRLTIPPKLWLGFQGIDVHNSLILNIASIPHDPNESISMEINEIDYDWN